MEYFEINCHKDSVNVEYHKATPHKTCDMKDEVVVKYGHEKTDEFIWPNGQIVTGADKERRVFGTEGATDSVGEMGRENQAVLL